MQDKYAGTNITSNFNVKNSIVGDVNRDGFVDSGDVMAIYSSMAGNSDPEIQTRSDVNSDGLVDSGDIMAIYSIMAGN